MRKTRVIALVMALLALMTVNGWAAERWPGPDQNEPERKPAAVSPLGVAQTLVDQGCSVNWTFRVILWSDLDPTNLRQLHSLPKGTKIWYPYAVCASDPDPYWVKATQLLFAFERADKRSREAASLRAQLNEARSHVQNLEYKIRTERAVYTNELTLAKRVQPTGNLRELTEQLNEKSNQLRQKIVEVGTLTKSRDTLAKRVDELLKRPGGDTSRGTLWGVGILMLLLGVIGGYLLSRYQTSNERHAFNAEIARLTRLQEDGAGKHAFEEQVVVPFGGTDHIFKIAMVVREGGRWVSYAECPGCAARTPAFDPARGYIKDRLVAVHNLAEHMEKVHRVDLVEI